MEILLAITVASSVILFGALISMGNERQKRAIDELREQVVSWAIQDLRLKCERLAREVRVDDPLDWLNSVLKRTCNIDERLQVDEIFENPTALVCTSQNGCVKIVLSPFSPVQIRQMMRSRRSRISQFTDRNPLFTLPRAVNIYEISLLNGGLLFDLEIPLAWKGLTNQEMGQVDRIWAYRIA